MTYQPYKDWVKHKGGAFERAQIVAVHGDLVKVSYLEITPAVSAGVQGWYSVADVEPST